MSKFCRKIARAEIIFGLYLQYTNGLDTWDYLVGNMPASDIENMESDCWVRLQMEHHRTGGMEYVSERSRQKASIVGKRGMLSRPWQRRVAWVKDGDRLTGASRSRVQAISLYSSYHLSFLHSVCRCRYLVFTIKQPIISHFQYERE